MLSLTYGVSVLRRYCQIQHTLHSIHYVKHPRYPALCVSPTGDLTLLDGSLRQYPITPVASNGRSQMLCSAGVIFEPVSAFRVVLVDTEGHIRIVRLSAQDDNIGPVQPGGEGWIGLPDTPLDISCAQISDDGVITALSKQLR